MKTIQINVSELVEEKTQTLTETKEVLQSIQQSVGESSDDTDLSQQAFADFLESTEISDKVLEELSELIDLQDPKPINELIENVEQSIQTFQDLQEIEQSNPQVFVDIQEALGINVDPQFDETLDIIQQNTQLFGELDELIQSNIQSFQTSLETDRFEAKSFHEIRSVGLRTIDEFSDRLVAERSEIIEVLTKLVSEFIEEALIKTLVTAEEELLIDALQRLFGEEQESFDLETIRRTEISDIDDVFAKTLIEELEKQSEFQYDLAETTLLDTLVNLNIESFVETFLENFQNLIEDTDKVQLLDQTLISELENNFENLIIESSFDDIIEELRALDFTEDVPEIQDLLRFVSTEESEFVENKFVSTLSILLIFNFLAKYNAFK